MNWHLTESGGATSTGTTSDAPGVYPADPETGVAWSIVVPETEAIRAAARTGSHAGMAHAIETEARRLGILGDAKRSGESKPAFRLRVTEHTGFPYRRIPQGELG